MVSALNRTTNSLSKSRQEIKKASWRLCLTPSSSLHNYTCCEYGRFLLTGCKFASYLRPNAKHAKRKRKKKVQHQPSACPVAQCEFISPVSFFFGVQYVSASMFSVPLFISAVMHVSHPPACRRCCFTGCCDEVYYFWKKPHPPK